MTTMQSTTICNVRRAPDLTGLTDRNREVLPVVCPAQTYQAGRQAAVTALSCPALPCPALLNASSAYQTPRQPELAWCSGLMLSKPS